VESGVSHSIVSHTSKNWIFTLMLIHHISVDFNTEHKCKNFDAIREWAKERQLPESVEPDFLEPPVAGDRIFDEIP